MIILFTFPDYSHLWIGIDLCILCSIDCLIDKAINHCIMGIVFLCPFVSVRTGWAGKISTPIKVDHVFLWMPHSIFQFGHIFFINLHSLLNSHVPNIFENFDHIKFLFNSLNSFLKKIPKYILLPIETWAKVHHKNSNAITTCKLYHPTFWRYSQISWRQISF